MDPESDPSYESLIENLPGFTYRCYNDPDWTMLYLSDQVQALTGYAPDELKKNNVCSYANLIHPEDRGRIWEEVQEAVQQEESFQLEYRLRTRDDRELWVWEQGQLIRQNGQEPPILQGFIQDITERKQEELENQVIRRISKLISHTREYSKAAAEIVRELCERTGWDYGELWNVKDQNADSMTADIYYNPENGDLEEYWQEAQGIRISKGEGLVGRVWASGQTEWLKNLSEHNGFLRSDLAAETELETALGVPCLAGESVVGVLVIYLNEDHRKDRRMIQLLTTVGEQIGSLLRQKQLENELADREHLYHQILEHIQADLWMIDLEFNEYLYTNPAFEETWGDYFEDVEDVREAFLEAVHPEDRERIRDAIGGAHESGEYEHEFRIRRPTDGELRWFHDRTFIITDEAGNPRRVLGLGEDITEKKLAEIKLRESERRFRQIAENINQVIWMYDAQFSEVHYVNSYYETLFGQSRESLRDDPESFLDVVHPEDRDQLQAALGEVTQNPDQPVAVEYRIQPREGEIRWVRSSAVPIEDESGSLSRIVGFTHDVTDRKEIEESLQERDRRFRQMTENIDEIFYLYDKNYTECLFLSSAYEQMWGYSPEPVFEDPWHFAEHIHEDDREEVLERKQAFLENPAWDECMVEYRIRRADGELRWMRDRMFEVRNEQGGVIRVAGVVEDITPQKTFEQKLREQEQRFRLMAETIDQAYFLVTPDYPDYDWIYVNPAFENLYDVTEDELQEDPMAWTKHVPEEDLETIESMLQSQQDLKPEDVQTQEIRVDPPGDETRWLRVRLYPVFENEQLTHLTGVSTDITRQKAVREELERSEQRFQEIAGAIDEIFWLTGVDGEPLYYVSPKIEEQWGLSVNELYEDPLHWMDAIHPEDRDRVREQLEELPEEPLELEFRIGGPDGNPRWVHHEIFPVYNDQGEIYRYAALSEDITEKKKLTDQLEASLEQKTVLLQEVHHRVKNNMQIISSILGLERHRGDPDSYRAILQHCQQRIQAMAAVHESLYSTEDIHNLDLRSYLTDVAQNLIQGASDPEGELTFTRDLPEDPIEVNLENAVPVGLVVNELVSNAIEHAGAKTDDLTITLCLKQTDDDMILLQIQDTGPGLPDSVDPDHPETLGLKLVQTLVVDQLQGSMDWSNDPGAHFSITVPIS